MILFKQHQQIHEELLNKSSTDLYEIRNQALSKLKTEKTLRDLKFNNTLPHKEIEKLIEIVVKIESYESNLGWWARTKRRLALTKEFALNKV